MMLEIRINGSSRNPDWGLYPNKPPRTYPYIIIEAAYGNQSLPHLTEQMLEYVTAPCHIMVAIGIKLFKLRKDRSRRIVVSPGIYIYMVGSIVVMLIYMDGRLCRP